ncbi:MAG: 16S rRNA (guanine(527)-N(7))-methyltransferase RsmG [Gammaproteobacteria bacterium]
MSSLDLSDTLKQGLTTLGEDPAAHPCDLYLQFIRELGKWNKAYNLTAIRDPERMITHHVLDSLSVLPFIHGKRCLDVGTGAGLPGMILALARPDTHWTLLDSKSKKVRFIQHLLREIKPENVEVVHARVEAYQPEYEFSTIITRALTTIAGFYRITTHLSGADSRLLAMKGDYPQQELSDLPAGHARVHQLKVPGIDSSRHLVVITERSES